MSMGLTRKQNECLLLIHNRLRADGVAPSYDEMGESLGLKSKSNIHRLVVALEERGYIERLPRHARAIEVLKLPTSYNTAAVSLNFEVHALTTRYARANGISLDTAANELLRAALVAA